MARAVQVDPKEIRRFLSGTGRLRPDVEERIRNVVRIGAAGAIIRAAVAAEVDKCQPYEAHKAALKAEANLKRAGMIDDEDDDIPVMSVVSGGRRSSGR